MNHDLILRLDTERRHQGIPLDTAADRIGTTRATVAGWPYGRSPRLSRVTAYAAVVGLHVTIDGDRYRGWVGARHPLVAQFQSIRLDRGLTQQQVADASGVTQQAISEWESGNADPRLAWFEWALEALGSRLVLAPADAVSISPNGMAA